MVQSHRGLLAAGKNRDGMTEDSVAGFRIRHTTRYVYGAPVSLGQGLARLSPRDADGQRAGAWKIRITPEPSFTSGHHDLFGNPVRYFSHQEPHNELQVEADGEIARVAPCDPAPDAKITTGDYAAWFGSRRGSEAAAAAAFRFESAFTRAGDPIRAWASESLRPDRPLREGLLELMSRVHTDFAFDPGATTVSTPLSEVFDKRAGVCQDFAHLALACVRSAGLAARYVSGYIETDPPPGQPRLLGADATHAWISVCLPREDGEGCAWLDLDPTNDQIPSGRHLTMAWGRDYGDVPPLKGVVQGGGSHSLHISVTVDRLPPA